jgi:class 3 adenylate cyclase
MGFSLATILKAAAEVVWDRLAWWTTLTAVDAVRYGPAQTALAVACAANDARVVGDWLAGARAQPVVREVSGWPHAWLRRAALAGEHTFGPTGSALIRWYGGALKAIVDQFGATSVQHALPARVHPGTLVPHPHDLAVLALDMRGFSRLTRELQDTQYLADLVGDYLTAMTVIVERHHGVVFQYTGDGLLAIFLPELTRSAPGPMLEALAGVVVPELHSAFDRLHDEWRATWRRRDLAIARVGLGSGLSYGTVTLGYLGPSGKKHVGVLGEPVNVAAFLCSQAPAGTLLAERAAFDVTGAAPPLGRPRRLRSRKAHQRIGVLAVDFTPRRRIYDA